MAAYHHQYQASNAEQNVPQNSTFLLDVLYCSEEHWEEGIREDNFQEEDEVEDNYCSSTRKPIYFPTLLEQDVFWDDGELISLFSKEEQNELYENHQPGPYLAGARRGAVEWMLKVNAHYSFSALTAVLAVNYLDRFLLRCPCQRGKPWTTQLAAVACLSLAAKVEETQVPLLLELQVEESRYIFEAKTIQKMEILVLSTLQWKMNPITPLSFLDSITRRLGLKDNLCREFLKRCERILLSVLSDSRFMSYLPSVVAIATMLHVVSLVEPRILVQYQNQLLGILRIDKDKIDDCRKFMIILDLASGGNDYQSNKRKFGSMPGSPNGVMDVSFSSDSSNDSWAAAAPSVASSPEPVFKKSRAQEQLLPTLSHSSADFPNIPR